MAGVTGDFFEKGFPIALEAKQSLLKNDPDYKTPRPLSVSSF